MGTFLRYCVAFLFVIGFIPLAYADIVWPSLYVAEGLARYQVIIADFLIETAFLKHFTQVDWWKTLKTSVIMNIATCTIGIAIIIIGGMGVDFASGGTFSTTNWIITLLFAVMVNTLIEGFIATCMLNIRFRKVFPWMFAAHMLSMVVAYLLCGQECYIIGFNNFFKEIT